MRSLVDQDWYFTTANSVWLTFIAQVQTIQALIKIWHHYLEAARFDYYYRPLLKSAYTSYQYRNIMPQSCLLSTGEYPHHHHLYLVCAVQDTATWEGFLSSSYHTQRDYQIWLGSRWKQEMVGSCIRVYFISSHSWEAEFSRNISFSRC